MIFKHQLRSIAFKAAMAVLAPMFSSNLALPAKPYNFDFWYELHVKNLIESGVSLTRSFRSQMGIGKSQGFIHIRTDNSTTPLIEVYPPEHLYSVLKDRFSLREIIDLVYDGVLPPSQEASVLALRTIVDEARRE